MSVGIRNIGNTCSVSTLLQCIVHCPHLVRIILGETYSNAHTFANILQHYIREIYTSPDEHNIIVQPERLIKCLHDSSNGLFPFGQQHDICELFVWFIEHLHEASAVKYEISNDVQGSVRKIWDAVAKLQNHKWSRIVNVCQGVTIQMLECTTCKDRPYNIEPFSIFYVEIPLQQETVSLCDRMMHVFDIETMEEWKCDTCGHKGALRQTRLWTLPNILVIVMKRFQNNMTKVSTPVYISPEIQFSPKTVLSKPDSSFTYRLHAIGNHSGSFGGGHYTCLAREKNNIWMHYDDEHMEKLQENIETVLAQNRDGYILFYERCN